MASALHEAVAFALSTTTTLFVVVDPFAIVPMFLVMTAGDSPERKRATARRAALAAFAVLAVFAAAGPVLLRLLGISLGAFRIGGGILLFLLAVDMLGARPSRQRTSPEEEAEGVDKEDVSLFPLTIPMLAGPGATSSVMVLVSRAEHAWQLGIVFAAIAVTCALTFAILRSALRVERYLGRTGLNVVQRVMGLILAGIAVQFVVDGIATTLPGLG
jgi:multiple antibiotic resistance protein